MWKILVTGVLCLAVGIWVGMFFSDLRIEGAQFRISKSSNNDCVLSAVELEFPEYTVIVNSPELNSLNEDSVFVMFFPDKVEYRVVARFTECSTIVSEARTALKGAIYYENIGSGTIEQYQR